MSELKFQNFIRCGICFMILGSTFNFAFAQNTKKGSTSGRTQIKEVEVQTSTLSEDDAVVDPQTGKKVIFTYKDNEKLDFDEITIEGDAGIPSDLSIGPIVDKKFSNRLPYRKSFNAEIRKGIERVR